MKNLSRPTKPAPRTTTAAAPRPEPRAEAQCCAKLSRTTAGCHD